MSISPEEKRRRDAFVDRLLMAAGGTGILVYMALVWFAYRALAPEPLHGPEFAIMLIMAMSLAGLSLFAAGAIIAAVLLLAAAIWPQRKAPTP